MMGPDGLRRATEVAILNANYVAPRLDAALPGALHRRPRPGGPRVHPRPAADHRGHRRHRRRRGQAPHRLRLPRPDDELPGGRHPDGRADRVRVPRRARPLLRRHDRHPRARSPRSSAGEVAHDDNPLRPRPPHRRGRARRRLGPPLHPRAGGLPARRACATASTGRRSAASTAATATATSCAPAPRWRPSRTDRPRVPPCDRGQASPGAGGLHRHGRGDALRATGVLRRHRPGLDAGRRRARSPW